LCLLAEAGIRGCLHEASVDLTLLELSRALRQRAWVLDVLRVDAQRPAMRGQLLDVEKRKLLAGEDLLDGDPGEVREVLVVDRVELVLRYQPHHVGELHRDGPAWL